MISRSLVIGTALAATVLLLGGCRKSAEESMTEAAIAAASGHEVEVEREGDQVTFKTEEGEMKVSSGEALPLPESFPNDVYLPKRYRVRSVLDVAGTQVISLSTEGEAMALFTEVRESMQSQGWKQTMSMQHDDHNGMLAFEKDKRNAVLSINGGDSDEVQIGVQLRERQ
jgi:hypothetical protein